MKRTDTSVIGITGSSGFVGSNALRYFHEKKAEVIALDRFVHPDRARAAGKLPGRLDWVLHFGASKSIEEAFEKPVEVYRRNMHSTMAALDIALSRNARFLYMSSYVYGKPKYLPVNEKHPTSVLNPYMGSKLLGEQMCCQINQCLGLSVIVLRGFTFYGPGQNGDQLIPSIVGSIRGGKTIVVKDPFPRRDYLYITDFLRLVDDIVHSKFQGFNIYNVGGGRPYTNIAVARMANALAGEPVTIHIEGRARRNDVGVCFAHIGKVQRDFRWRPEVDLRAGLRRCITG